MQINDRNFGWLGLTPQTALEFLSIYPFRGAALAELFPIQHRLSGRRLSSRVRPACDDRCEHAKTRAVTPTPQRTTLSGQITSFTLEESR